MFLPFFLSFVVNSASRPNGINFKVDSRYATPKVGDVVTIDYDTYSLKEGVPVNPKITRIRHDLAWEDVVDDYRLRNEPRLNVPYGIPLPLFFICYMY